MESSVDYGARSVKCPGALNAHTMEYYTGISGYERMRMRGDFMRRIMEREALESGLHIITLRDIKRDRRNNDPWHPLTSNMLRGWYEYPINPSIDPDEMRGFDYYDDEPDRYKRELIEMIDEL